MEKNQKVQLTTINQFIVPKEELKHLYITLALTKYPYLRTPNYNEELLLEHLENDLKKFYTEMQTQVEKEPNNLIINKILVFLNFHYMNIRNVREGA